MSPDLLELTQKRPTTLATSWPSLKGGIHDVSR